MWIIVVSLSNWLDPEDFEIFTCLTITVVTVTGLEVQEHFVMGTETDCGTDAPETQMTCVVFNSLEELKVNPYFMTHQCQWIHV